MSPADSYRLLVAIETDATRYHGAEGHRPRLLTSQQAGQMLAHLAADLDGLLPGLSRCSLAGAGALFDQTQVLRPGYPLFTALQDLVPEVTGKSESRLIGCGTGSDGTLPPGLQPEADIPPGLLQLLPLLLRGPADLIGELGELMEHRFLAQGQLSAHSAQWLQSTFDISVVHARFMTLADLGAMFRLQLEHFGFLPLWELVDAALHRRASVLQVSAASGQVFTWRDGAVHTVYETFDQWALEGAGKGLESRRGRLAGGYAEWTRVNRQYFSTLRAHRVPVLYHLPGHTGQALAGSFFTEAGQPPERGRHAEVTEHSFAELGTVCVSLVHGSQQLNYYPLEPAGLNDINCDISARGLAGGTLSFPGTILYDEKSRRLVADTPGAA